MTITRGIITRGGITKGGICRSQQGFNPYALYVDPVRYGARDMVSQLPLTTLAAGTRYDLVNGVQTTFAANTPVVTEKGIRSVGAYSNSCLWSEDFANSQWLQLDAATISPEGLIDISATSNSRVAQIIYGLTTNKTYTFSLTLKIVNTTPGYFPISFNVEGTTTNYLAYLTPEFKTFKSTVAIINNPNVVIYLGTRQAAGSTIFKAYVKNISVNAKKYPHPYIKTEGTAASSVTESGTAVAGEATNGIFFNNIATNFPLFKAALESQGTLSFIWTPGYSAADVGGSMNILSFDGATDNLRYNQTTGAIELFDGTNTVSKAITPVANTPYTIRCDWEGSQMRVSVDGVSGTTGAFDGSFNPGNDVIMGLNNPELQYIKEIKIWKEAQW